MDIDEICEALAELEKLLDDADPRWRERTDNNIVEAALEFCVIEHSDLGKAGYDISRLPPGM